MTVSTSLTAAERVNRLRERVNQALPALAIDAEPDVLYDPVRYVLASQGKRIRPILLLLTAEAFGTRAETALPASLAVEVFHNFTLVHDDIMDNADARRGQPTVHVEWDEGTAILTGDMLFAMSYDLLAQVEGADLRDMMQVYHTMVERLCRGQALDSAFEDRSTVTVDEYLEMIDCKTSALLQAAFELGGIIGGASASQRKHLRTIGKHVGRAFQIQDDLLDLTADTDHWGKAVGGDLVEGKKTFIVLRALERAEGAAYDWFARIVNDGGLPPEDIPEARTRMERLGVFEEAREAVDSHSETAKETLGVLPSGSARDTLLWLINQMQARLH